MRDWLPRRTAAEMERRQQRLNPRRMALSWMPETTLGRMLADYIGVTWCTQPTARDLTHWHRRPRNGRLRQAIYAARS